MPYIPGDTEEERVKKAAEILKDLPEELKELLEMFRIHNGLDPITPEMRKKMAEELDDEYDAYYPNDKEHRPLDPNDPSVDEYILKRNGLYGNMLLGHIIGELEEMTWMLTEELPHPKKYETKNTYPIVWVQANSPEEAATKAVQKLRELDQRASKLGGDPLTDLFSIERGGYVIEFRDGSTGVAKGE